jgi:exodeoxyribonuclease VII large subunit
MSRDTASIAQPDSQPVLSVSQLTDQVKMLLENAFTSVWVTGEISNFARPQSGHCYFTLKDDQSQIRAVMWRGTAARMRIDLSDGMEVICQGHLDVYAPRGSYQLVVEALYPKGMGALELALRKLRDKLAAEGLFDPARKRPLPAFPQTIALVTSPTGAAVRDFLEVLRRRWRGIRVLVVPTRVQGDGSADEIAAAIRTANRLRGPIDVLVVGRGGGSLEDLWAFNEEVVVRAIAASRIPVISAVGHEIDVTLSDMAADVRALTPSEAAERVVPSTADVVASLQSYLQRLASAMRRRAQLSRARLDAVAAHRLFRRPLDHIHDLERRLDELSLQSQRAMRRIEQTARARTDILAGKLHSLSPIAVLARGYSLTTHMIDGRLVQDARELGPGDRLATRFSRGEAISEVREIKDN